jgi:hypothetical protein
MPATLKKRPAIAKAPPLRKVEKVFVLRRARYDMGDLSEYDDWVSSNGAISMCHEELSEYVLIPEAAKKLYVRVSSERTSRSALPIDLEFMGYGVKELPSVQVTVGSYIPAVLVGVRRALGAMFARRWRDAKEGDKDTFYVTFEWA